MSYFGKFFLRGPDADAAVEWIFTNNIANCQVGKTVYTVLLTWYLAMSTTALSAFGPRKNLQGLAKVGLTL